MNNRTALIPFKVASTNAWRPRLFRAAYILATAIAMLGWLWAIGWVTFAVAIWLIA
jgi:hypothetical protein